MFHLHGFNISIRHILTIRLFEYVLVTDQIQISKSASDFLTSQHRSLYFYTEYCMYVFQGRRKLEKAIYTVHSNIVYSSIFTNTKTKLVVLRHIMTRSFEYVLVIGHVQISKSVHHSRLVTKIKSTLLVLMKALGKRI